MASQSSGPQGTVPPGLGPWANGPMVDPTALSNESIGNMASEGNVLEQTLGHGVSDTTAPAILTRAAAQLGRMTKFVVTLWAHVKGNIEIHDAQLADHASRIAALQAGAAASSDVQTVVVDA